MLVAGLSASGAEADDCKDTAEDKDSSKDTIGVGRAGDPGIRGTEAEARLVACEGWHVNFWKRALYTLPDN